MKVVLQLLCIFVLALSINSFLIPTSQAASSVSDRIRFHSLTIEDGLTQSTVNNIAEDRLGYMWFGTQDGLNRYDGSRIDQIRHFSSEADGLVSPTISLLIYDTRDTMWVLTPQGLDSIDIHTLEITHWTEKITELNDAEDKSEITAIALAEDNTLVAATRNFVVRINAETGSVSRLSQFDELFSEHDTRSIFLAKRRLYFVENNCLVSVDIDGEDKRSQCLKDASIQRIQANRENPEQFFVLGRTGFATYNIDADKLNYHLVADSRSSGYKTVHEVLPHNNGYWLATEAGLKYWSNEENKVAVEFHSDFSDRYSINNNYVMTIWKSSTGLLWIGSTSGVNYWKSEQQFIHLLQKREVMNFKQTNFTTSVLKTYNDDLLIGTNSAGIYQYNDDFSVLQHHSAFKVGEEFISPGYVSGMVEDRHRTLWLVTDAGLFFKPYGEEGFHFLDEVYDVNGQLLDLRDLFSIIESRNGDIWLGGIQGFFRIKIGEQSTPDSEARQLQFMDYTEVVPKQLMESKYGIYTIYEDLQGYLWLGGATGLARFTLINNEVKLFESDPEDPQTLSSSDITVIYEDLLGVLWVGTVSGLNRVRYNSKGNVYFQRITESDGLIDDNICAILSDSSGYLWVATANGLVKFHPDKGVPVNFTYEDGLQYSEFFTNADFADEEGNLYFGGVNGVTMFNPDEILINKENKELKVTVVEQKQQRLPLTNEGNTYFAEVKDDGVVSIRLSTFDFINGQKSNYRYRIDTFEDSWVELERPVIFLHDFQREQLVIRAQVRQKNGRWGDKETVLLLNIEKGFWSSAQGFMLYLLMLSLVVIGVAFYLFRYFSRRLSLQEKKLKEKKAQTQLLLSEKKTLLYQVEDLQYSLSEQRYLSERLENQIENVSVNDQLTGFKSKHYLKQHIDRELQHIASTWLETDGIDGVYLGVFAVDIDNLATINNEHGNLCGNEVLKQAAECLRTICYGTDTLVRWQGATFLVLSRGIEKREQMIMAEKIRSIIASRKFDLGNGASIDVTCSVGFGRFPFLNDPKELITWEQLIYVISRALSVAKANSRNAWLGIYTNQFSHPQEIRTQITTNLGGLLMSGQLDYVSSIPKSNKIDWDAE